MLDAIHVLVAAIHENLYFYITLLKVGGKKDSDNTNSMSMSSENVYAIPITANGAL
jgi:hypothetical protein